MVGRVFFFFFQGVPGHVCMMTSRGDEDARWTQLGFDWVNIAETLCDWADEQDIKALCVRGTSTAQNAQPEATYCSCI